MRIQRESSLKFYLKRGLSFLLFMAAALTVFFFLVQKDVNRNVEKALADNVEMQNHHLQTLLDLQFQHLESLAECISENVKQGKELTCEENMNLIRILQRNSNFERASIIDIEGNSHYDEGSVKNVSQRRYFQEGIAGKRTLSDPLESSIDGQTRVVVGVPIFAEGALEEDTIGILAASYDMTALSRMLFEDIYNGLGFSVILTREGKVISYDASNVELQESLESIGSNLFEKYEKNIEKSKSMKKVMTNFQEGKKGCKEIRMTSNSWYFAYVPLSYNDWMVCYFIPSECARSAYQFINRYEFALCAALLTAVIFLILGIVREFRKSQKKLMEYANTDALTGVCNKEKTRNDIEQWLTKEEIFTGIQVFIIMDIDAFKEVNDTYGHMVGDQVLQTVGVFLRKKFRSEDIVGRIGGDEFVIFMKNAGTLEDVERKAGEITEGIGRIEIPELGGRKLSVSIGISFAPAHGATYSDLYHFADDALYQTKRRGKNGYTIFRKETSFSDRPDPDEKQNS